MDMYTFQMHKSTESLQSDKWVTEIKWILHETEESRASEEYES